MKKLPKFILLFFLLTLLSSFLTKNYFNVEPPSLGGIKQIFVNSYKQIKSSDSLISVLSFKNKVNDSTLSSFQIFTFKFEESIVLYDHYVYYDTIKKDSVFIRSDTLNFKILRLDENFVVINVNDKYKHYNNITDKVMIINLNDNPNYPQLQIVWKIKNGYEGDYSVDTRPFEEMFADSQTSIFNE
jgi:hypothetical protein